MLELEKKWLLKQAPILTSYGFELVKTEFILQTYLSPTERLRAIAEVEDADEPDEDTPKHYEHFFKTPVGVGAYVENVTSLSEEEWNRSLENGISDVAKIRRTYMDPDTGFRYEVDALTFEDPRVPILLLEIEFQDKYKTMEEVDASFKLPEFMKKYVISDVTGNKDFSNYNLSELREDDGYGIAEGQRLSQAEES